MPAHRLVVLAVVLVSLSGLAIAQDEEPALANWSAPPYWNPAVQPRTEGQPGGAMVAHAQGMEAQAEALPSSPLPFIAIAPCRIVDTRVAVSDGFHQPHFADDEARTFPFPSSTDCPGLPATAEAYSLNVQFRPMSQLSYLTAYPTGTTRPTASTMTAGPSAWVQNAAVVPAGSGGAIDIYCQWAGRVVIDINGYYAVIGARFGVNRTDRLSWLTVKGAAPVTLAGTVTIFNGDAGVIGVSTAFVSQAGVGDRVTVNAETRTVVAITDDTHLTVDSAWTSNATGAPISDAGSLLRLDDSADVARLVVSDQGKVGVGVIVPQQTLSVGGTLGVTGGGGTTVLQADPGQVGTLAYTLPQAGADGLLRNTAGTLTWDIPTLLSSSGSTGQVAFWSGATSLAGSDNLFWDNASGRLGLGTTTPGYQLDLTGMIHMPATTATGGAPTAGVLLLGGNPFLHNYGTANTFVGMQAGNFTMTGVENTAHGSDSLFSNTTGDSNTASGVLSLAANTSGSHNTASGRWSLIANTVGSSNTAFGAGSLAANTEGNSNAACGTASLGANTTGYNNTAVGTYSLDENTTGGYNAAIGFGALGQNTTGSANIAIGADAGTLTTGSYNIDIGNAGFPGESNTIRIGDANQNRTFIAGIRGVNVGATGTAVFINSSGQLGTSTSSIRFKQDVRDMGAASSRLMELRPVTFRYKTQPDGLLQFGLIAEEVEEVMPELVVRDATGQVESVAYHELPAMLLNELQKQHAQITGQAKTIQAQQTEIEALKAELGRIAGLRRLVQELMATRAVATTSQVVGN